MCKVMFYNTKSLLPNVMILFVIFAGSLSHEAREAFLSALVSEGTFLSCYSLVFDRNLRPDQNEFHSTGRAEWLDKSRRKCLLLWHRIPDWADLIISFVSIALEFLLWLICA